VHQVQRVRREEVSLEDPRSVQAAPYMPFLCFVAISVLVVDQVTKWFALQHLPPASSIPVIPNVFHLSYVQNTGIAFGLFRDYSALLLALITGSVLALLIGSRWLAKQSASQRLAYGFILGGALGNWIDRVRFQHVIDFLDFRIWPVFNFADTFITIGVLLFIWFIIRGR
jgi:signal peptidase II